MQQTVGGQCFVRSSHYSIDLRINYWTGQRLPFSTLLAWLQLGEIRHTATPQRSMNEREPSVVPAGGLRA